MVGWGAGLLCGVGGPLFFFFFLFLNKDLLPSYGLAGKKGKLV
jgi:hypothetical protein